MTTDITGPTGRLHIDDNGSGDELPVVFIHAFAGSLVHWADQLAHLRPGRRAIAFDLRGHGGAAPGRSAPGRVPLQQADQILSQMTSDYATTMAGYWDRLLADATPRVKDQITSEMGRMPQDVAMGLIKATFAYDPLPALRDYPGIVETVTIGDSPYDLHKQVPDVPDEHVDGTSHWVQMDKPAAFDRILDAFLARVDAAEAVDGQDRKGSRLASLRH
jgi:pimeloyl-ACP methyl ester carboxylesterase